MRLKFVALCFLPLFASLCIAQGPQNASLSQQMDIPSTGPAIQITSWTEPKVQHVYGLPERA